MIYTDLIEYNIVGHTRVPLLSLYFQAKIWGIITTRQYTNYQTFSNLQFRQLLKNSFHSIHIDLKYTSGERITFLSVGVARLVLIIRKASNIHFQRKTRCKMIASRQVEISYYRGTGRQRGRIRCTCTSYWQHINSIFT